MDTVGTMDHLERVMALRRLPLFSGLDTRDLDPLAQVTSERAYPPDEPVYVQGEPGDEMMMVIDGTARITWRLPDETVEVAMLRPGAVVGEMALLTDRPRAADVHAGPGGLVGLVIERKAFESILCERPGVALELLSVLAERLATTPTTDGPGELGARVR